MSTNGSNTQPTTGKKMVIAVVAEEVQLTDITCLDVLTNCSTLYTTEAESFGTGPLIPLSVPMEVHWPSSSMKPAKLSGEIKFQPTCTYDECPRDLDLLLVGGPTLSHRPAGADTLFRECWARTKVVMTTCVGSMWMADSGVLKNHTATTNRGFLDAAKKMHPDTKWEYSRWVVDKKEGGELWTSGGAQAGIDMMATFVRKNFPAPLAGFATEALDVDETARGNTYKQAQEDFKLL